MTLHRLVPWLTFGRWPAASGLPEQRAAAALLAETREHTDAEALALQAAVDTTGPKAIRALAGIAQQLDAAYAGTLARTEALFGPTLGRLEAHLTQLLARTQPERLDAVERDCAVQHARLAAQSRPQLVSARRTERSLWRALRAFRFRHRLAREARYPESRALHYSAVTFVCVLEALANTWAFAQGSSLGLLGGFAQALVVASVNVVFAFFAGRAASGLFHHDGRIKSLAAGLVGAWAVFEGLLALTVAHYRIALVDNVDTAPWVALARMHTIPLAIDDVTSVLLTLFTLAFGVAALLTGLATDDRHPGFGARTRAHARARARLEKQRAGYLGAIDAIYLPAPERLAALTAEAAGISETYQHTVETLKETARALTQALEEVAAAYRETVLTAREAFAGVSGQPAPTAALAPLPASALLAQAQAAIAEADKALATFPTRLARLETERAAAETRLQRQHAAALAAAPAYFAHTEALAESESDHDEADGAKVHQRQHALWEEDTGEGHTDEPLPSTAADSGAPPPPRKGNGADRPQERAC